MTETPLDYGTLMREMMRRAAVVRQPAYGAFELTSRCNLFCRMCYVRHPAGHRQQAAKELPAAAWLELARQAAAHGMAFVLLTGGEPLVRPDFFDLYQPLTRMGLVLTLFTNGTLITPEIAARLAEAPPSRTEITLYGATAATYEAVTGVRGSFAACLAGIEALLAHRVPLGLKTTVTRQNVEELEAMRRLAHSWGLTFSAGWLLCARPDGAPSEVKDCRLSAAECVALEATDQASAHEWTEAALREAGPPGENIFVCHAGKAAFAVNPAGEMNVCLVLSRPAVRPLEIGFGEAWRQVQHFVETAPPLHDACRACEVRQYCARCPAWSLNEVGSLTEPVPYLCDLAHARKELYAPSA